MASASLYAGRRTVRPSLAVLFVVPVSAGRVGSVEGELPRHRVGFMVFESGLPGWVRPTSLAAPARQAANWESKAVRCVTRIGETGQDVSVRNLDESRFDASGFQPRHGVDRTTRAECVSKSTVLGAARLTRVAGPAELALDRLGGSVIYASPRH